MTIANVWWEIGEHAVGSTQKTIGYFLGGTVVIVGGHFLKEFAKYYQEEKRARHDMDGLGWALFGAFVIFIVIGGGIAYWVEG